MSAQIKTFKNCLPWLFMIFVLMLFQACENPQTALEQSNLKKAIYFMEILENRNDLEPSERIEILRNECLADNYIQHSPHIEDGPEALLKLFEGRYKKYPELSMSIKRTASQGDFVWLHLHIKHSPDHLGSAAIHIFRMKDGKVAEHWGAGQPVPEKSKNNNTMF